MSTVGQSKDTRITDTRVPSGRPSLLPVPAQSDNTDIRVSNLETYWLSLYNSITTALATYLPLAGGTLTGTLSTNSDITMTGGELTLAVGTGINEFSTDTTMSGNSDDAVPTEKATKTYVDTVSAAIYVDLDAVAADVVAVAGDSLQVGNNLSDLNNTTTARANLGLGTLATQSGTFSGTSSGTNTGDQTITLTSDVTGSGTGSFATTIANDAVSDAKLRNSGALTVIGRSANTTGDPADIAGTASSDAVLRVSGTTLGFGTVATAGIANNAVTNGKIAARTALSVMGNTGPGAANVADIAATDSSGQVLRESGSGALSFGTVATAGIADAAITRAKLSNATALSVIGRTANSSGVPADIAATAATDSVLRESGSVIGFGTIATAGIANDAVTYAKMQNVSATDKLLGRSTAGAGDVEEIACTAAGRALIDDAAASNQRTTLGLGNAATFPLLATGYYSNVNACTVGSTQSGVTKFGESSTIPVPSGKTFYLWQIDVLMETGATAGSNYDLEAGIVTWPAGTYTSVVTSLNNSNGTRVYFNGTATDSATPLYSVAGPLAIQPYMKVQAGSTGSTAANNNAVNIIFSIS